MKILCVGGGPAGLYLAISLKLRDPGHEVLVIERNRADDTFGWGVVLSDQTLDHLRTNDPVSMAAIEDAFAYWDDIEVHYRGAAVRSTGHGFCGIGRKRLLEILQERARELGVEMRFETEVTDLDPFGPHDLVVAADGINSRFRAERAEAFRPEIDLRPNRFTWLGTSRSFDAFTFVFEETDHGWAWAHAYQFDADTSTFIVEMQEPTWHGLGLDRMEPEESIALCEELFARTLQGHRLRTNAAHLRGSAAWIQFPRITCGRWHDGNVVLLGDSAHTAHFSIGSGSKLAMEDAIELAARLDGRPLEQALSEYEDARRLEVLRLQNAARNSMEWFERLPRYTRFDPEQFTYALLTRSQRVSHENLRLRDPDWLAGLEVDFARRANGSTSPRRVPPMFTPFRRRDLELRNRVAVSPMSMYSAVDGMPDDWHLVHYGARAQGGAALLFTEMTDVTPDGRITPGCPGIWTDEQGAAWARIVEFVHRHTLAKIALQLGHAGPKGSTKVPWEGEDEPLDDGNWPLLAPSAVPWSARNQVPREMNRADMDAVRDAHVRATERAIEAGFDLLELHCAHGYLLSAFITPLTNHRTDEYGGSLENRLRYPLEVFTAIREAWPEERPMSVRISATDWVGDEGITGDDAVAVARAFALAGADVIDVSAGQTSIRADPVYGRMFQTPFSDQIRNEAEIATMAVGNITEADQVNSIIAAGRADLCLLARPHLSDPYWTLRAAAEQGVSEVTPWPEQYWSGRDQLVRLAERANAEKT
ncbi:MAG: bifunctional salicylyl-CoA 5-hydroxylase/oxidoreductase [Actinobacteria bacterium]|nr:bifunctional salicylyl-CoA 5-hydroxylase/oxidoreductase [Actinomycetota bacterium]